MDTHVERKKHDNIWCHWTCLGMLVCFLLSSGVVGGIVLYDNFFDLECSEVKADTVMPLLGGGKESRKRS